MIPCPGTKARHSVTDWQADRMVWLYEWQSSHSECAARCISLYLHTSISKPGLTICTPPSGNIVIELLCVWIYFLWERCCLKRQVWIIYMLHGLKPAKKSMSFLSGCWCRRGAQRSQRKKLNLLSVWGWGWDLVDHKADVFWLKPSSWKSLFICVTGRKYSLFVFRSLTTFQIHYHNTKIYKRHKAIDC